MQQAPLEGEAPTAAPGSVAPDPRGNPNANATVAAAVEAFASSGSKKTTQSAHFAQLQASLAGRINPLAAMARGPPPMVHIPREEPSSPSMVMTTGATATATEGQEQEESDAFEAETAHMSAAERLRFLRKKRQERMFAKQTSVAEDDFLQEVARNMEKKTGVASGTGGAGVSGAGASTDWRKKREEQQAAREEEKRKREEEERKREEEEAEKRAAEAEAKRLAEVEAERQAEAEADERRRVQEEEEEAKKNEVGEPGDETEVEEAVGEDERVELEVRDESAIVSPGASDEPVDEPVDGIRSDAGTESPHAEVETETHEVETQEADEVETQEADEAEEEEVERRRLKDERRARRRALKLQATAVQPQEPQQPQQQQQVEPSISPSKPTLEEEEQQKHKKKLKKKTSRAKSVARDNEHQQQQQEVPVAPQSHPPYQPHQHPQYQHYQQQPYPYPPPPLSMPGGYPLPYAPMPFPPTSFPPLYYPPCPPYPPYPPQVMMVPYASPMLYQPQQPSLSGGLATPTALVPFTNSQVALYGNSNGTGATVDQCESCHGRGVGLVEKNGLCGHCNRLRLAFIVAATRLRQRCSVCGGWGLGLVDAATGTCVHCARAPKATKALAGAVATPLAVSAIRRQPSRTASIKWDDDNDSDGSDWDE